MHLIFNFMVFIPQYKLEQKIDFMLKAENSDLPEILSLLMNEVIESLEDLMLQKVRQHVKLHCYHKNKLKCICIIAGCARCNLQLIPSQVVRQNIILLTHH